MICRKCKVEIWDDSIFCSKCGSKQGTTQRTKSRGNGQGSVFQLPNKTWIATRVIGYTIGEDGKKHKQTVSKSGFRTKREAVAYLPTLLQQQPEERRKMLTFLELYNKWEPTHQAGKSTMDCYRSAKK